MSFKFQCCSIYVNWTKYLWLHFRCGHMIHLLRYFHNFSHFCKLIFINFRFNFFPILINGQIIIHHSSFLFDFFSNCQPNAKFTVANVISHFEFSLIYFDFVWHLFGFANSVNRLRKERACFFRNVSFDLAACSSLYRLQHQSTDLFAVCWWTGKIGMKHKACCDYHHMNVINYYFFVWIFKVSTNDWLFCWGKKCQSRNR